MFRGFRVHGVADATMTQRALLSCGFSAVLQRQDL